MAAPAVGEMILYDYIKPPLLDGEYQMRVETDVTIGTNAQPLDGKDAFFNVEGPRFSLSPAEVSGVFPPRNGHGAFEAALPHIAFGRRTLPWERVLAQTFQASPDGTPYPWLALVLFEESECTIQHNQRLEDVVPPAVFDRLNRPQGIFCDSVTADEELVKNILPMPSELQLLTHVRQVNVDDRELAAGDSDGFFAVVMSNRLPNPGLKHRACLVSVEERTDLLPTTDVVSPVIGVIGIIAEPGIGVAAGHPAAAQAVTDVSFTASELTARLESGGTLLAEEANLLNFGNSRLAATVLASGLRDPKRTIRIRPTAKLVLLHSWAFTCDVGGTFRELMQHLNVGMIGQVKPDSSLQVTDTGHIAVDVINRLGAHERAWYRGPLVPQPLSRDPNGPYHSADQARRIAADTGAEDVSYACAFEVGRLLAAADARLGQELMRWRRGAYSESSRTSVISSVSQRMTLIVASPQLSPLANVYAASALARVAHGAGPLVDPYSLTAVEASPLLRPAVIQEAFQLATPQEATLLLGRAGVLDTPVAVQPPSTKPVDTLDSVIHDGTGLISLAGARSRVVDNINTHLNAQLPKGAL